MKRFAFLLFVFLVILAAAAVYAGNTSSTEQLTTANVEDDPNWAKNVLKYKFNLMVNDVDTLFAHTNGITNSGNDMTFADSVFITDDLVVGDDVDVTGDLTAATATVSGLSTLALLKMDSLIVNTDGSETMTVAQSGCIVVSTKSDGATTVTLPDATAAVDGVMFVIMQEANQNLVVTATTADNNDFVADAVATSDQVSCETADHKIGSGIIIVGANSKYHAFALNSECPLTVEAAD